MTESPLNKYGFKKMVLNSSVLPCEFIEPIQHQEFTKNYIFRPGKESFYYAKSIQKVEYDEEFDLEKVFIAVDENKTIKRIIIFALEVKEKLVAHFDHILETPHNEGNSLKDGVGTTNVYLWNTVEGSTISLIDLSESYGCSTLMIEYVKTTDLMLSSKYSIIKVPW